MKNQSILRRSGGAVIKLKNDKKWIVKLILLILGTFLFCYAAFYQVDYLMNGTFVDWFDRHFVQTETGYPPSLDTMYMTQHIDWSSLKAFCMFAFVIVTLFLVLVTAVTAYVYNRRKTRKTLSDLSQRIYRYMEKDLDIEDAFPPPYGEVGAQMEQVKFRVQKEEQRLLMESQRKNDLITYLAHDLKTPLTSVIGYLSLLEEAPDMPMEQKAKYTHIALEKAQRLEGLTEEFFEITQYNLQNIFLEKEKLDLSYMLMQMAEEFYPILSAHGNQAQLQVGENLELYADPERLARVFHNILKNAVAYSDPGTPVKIQAFQEQGQMVILFENQGKDIPKEKLDRIFEKFFRLDGSRRSHTGGAGLGLAIAKEIVELHGGTIAAKSENHRVSFTVKLPLSS